MRILIALMSHNQPHRVEYNPLLQDELYSYRGSLRSPDYAPLLLHLDINDLELDVSFRTYKPESLPLEVVQNLQPP
ncbi:hypothetical protein Tco_1042247 [Tanacetum coccineum]|uniref:Uncharacterized protein n=1 Tax=Tanacetum coccineum TaxID=301880 RepID=A0ABQ5GKP3_9ASTR